MLIKNEDESVKVLLIKYNAKLHPKTIRAIQEDIVHQIKNDGVLILDKRCSTEIVDIDNIKCSGRDGVMDDIKSGKGLKPLC